MGSKAYTDALLPIISLPNLATPRHSHATSANQHFDAESLTVRLSNSCRTYNSKGAKNFDKH